MSLSTTKVTTTPSPGLHVQDLADGDGDAVGLGQRLVQRVLAHHLTQRGLCDLVDGGGDVVDFTSRASDS